MTRIERRVRGAVRRRLTSRRVGRPGRRVDPNRSMACVMGNTDLVRPLVAAGIRCAAVAQPGAPIRYSRFVAAVVDWPPPGTAVPESDIVEQLLALAATQAEPPVLYYETDAFLLFVSRNRERLATGFRFVIDEPAKVADYVDKARFHALAQRLGLPVPATRVLSPATSAPPSDLPFPLIVKPLTRGDGQWAEIEQLSKVLRVEDAAGLATLWPRLAATGQDMLAQQDIPGPETMIESYHCYVDERGAIAGEFTGKKIRTRPVEYGHSTALRITSCTDVLAEGRAAVAAMGLRGVAKLDFKRAPDGALWLLEVNPRFNIWHYPGAIAGVNLPGLVHADLTGAPRPEVTPVREGVHWWHPLDVKAAREWGVPFVRWARWSLRTEAKSVLNWDDPMPFVGHLAWRLRNRLARSGSPMSRAPLAHPTSHGRDEPVLPAHRRPR